MNADSFAPTISDTEAVDQIAKVLNIESWDEPSDLLDGIADVLNKVRPRIKVPISAEAAADPVLAEIYHDGYRSDWATSTQTSLTRIEGQGRNDENLR